MWRTRLVFTWSLFAISVFYLVSALGISRGTAVMPGPGAFPLVVGIGFTLVSLSLAVSSTFSREMGDSPFPCAADGGRVLGLIASLALYAATLPALGHPLSTCISFGAALRVMGLRDRKKLLIGSLVAAAVSWYIFGVMLGVSIPFAPFIGF